MAHIWMKCFLHKSIEFSRLKRLNFHLKKEPFCFFDFCCFVSWCQADLNLAIEPRMILKSRSSCLYLLNARTAGMDYLTSLRDNFLTEWFISRVNRSLPRNWGSINWDFMSEKQLSSPMKEAKDQTMSPNPAD